MAKARRGYGEGAFFRTPDGYWHYRLSVGNYANGKRKFKEFKGKNRMEIALRVGTYKRQYGYTCPDERQNMFLSAFILDWAENVKRNEIKEASYNRLLSTVKVHICPALGGVRLKDLTGEMIQKDLINSMRDQICPQTKRPYSLSSIKKAFVYLNACMEYAVMIDVLPKNPCRSVTIPTKSQRPPRAYRFFNDVEVARFITACQRSTCTTVWALEVAMYTGLREGELCALRPADIDLAGKRIYVHATLIKRKAEGNGAKSEFIYQPETKNGKMRIVPLNQRALELFRDRLKQCPRGSNAYLVTLTDKGFRGIISQIAQICLMVCTNSNFKILMIYFLLFFVYCFVKLVLRGFVLHCLNLLWCVGGKRANKKSPLIWDVHNSLVEFTWPLSKDNVPRNFLRVM